MGSTGVRCPGLLLTHRDFLTGPGVDYYEVGCDDDDGNDDYDGSDDYDEGRFDGFQFLDVPVAEEPIPYSYCGFRKSFLCPELPPQLPRTSPTVLDARLDRLPTPRLTWLTAEVGNPPHPPSCSPGAVGSQVDITRGVPSRGPRRILIQGIPPAGSREECAGAGGRGRAGKEEGREEEAEEEGG